ncbi:MAG TPA: acyl-CoA dehydrogenase family protein [Acidimicrobiia bacterium]|nr:acyl-CoA dehydrogenase family protein [Acidimicrobiia bacterium]
MNDTSTAEPVVEIERRVAQLLASFPPETTEMTTFLGAQFDAGLAWVHFPIGRGGMAAPIALQGEVDRRLHEAGAPSGRMLNTTAYGQGAATILAYGTDDQQERYLRRIFTCEDIWCQLFSEPGAGSDLAGLATRAVLDGDEWVVNGQKVWTTRGHLARYGLLLARTDPDVAKHAGLTYFVLDMSQPAVTVRPLRQMDGGASFNEVFIVDARIPDAERLGETGQGWAVSNTTLMNERYNFGGTPARGSGAIARAVEAWQGRTDRTSPSALARRDTLLRLWIEAEAQRLTMLRATVARAQGKAGAEGSIGKLAGSELGQRIAALTVDLLGADGMLIEGYGPDDREHWSPQRGLIGSPAGTIAGGTSAIQRNIIGERVLGLPREPDPFKGQPWSSVPRN